MSNKPPRLISSKPKPNVVKRERKMPDTKSGLSGMDERFLSNIHVAPIYIDG